MSNRRKYTYEEKVKEVKEKNLESGTSLCSVPEIEKIESMGFKTADTGETVMELSIPTIDELDNYFSSIGLEALGGNF